MTQRVWLTTIGPGRYAQRVEPEHLNNVTVTVRQAGGIIPFDGVWFDGQRVYDTWVLIDGRAVYHSPIESVGSTSFDWHEQAGGGHAVP